MANKFSPSDAAVSIFTFAKLNPQFTFKFMGFTALLSVLLLAILAYSGLSEFNMVAAKIDPNNEDIAPLLEAMKLINWPVLTILFLGAALIGAIINAMALKKLVRNQELSGLGFEFGKDEMNIFLGSLLFGLLIFVTIFATTFIFAIFALLLKPLAFLAPIFVILIMVFIMGRFGMWGVLTIANKKISLKESFDFTKEQFWSFVGAFMLCGTLVIIFSLFVQAILGVVFSNIMPAGTFFKAPKSKEELLAIGTIIYQLSTAFVSSFGSLAILCVGAYAYHQIEAGNQPIAQDQ